MKILHSFLSIVLGATLSGAGATDARAMPGTDDVVAAVTDGVQHVRIEGGSYFFKPRHVTLKVNVPVVLEVSVESGLAPHSFVIQAPQAGIQIEERLSSEVKAIRFTPTATGRFPFYCGKGLPFVPSHRERGMEGVLDVVE